jgi:hypothetical protein
MGCCLGCALLRGFVRRGVVWECSWLAVSHPLLLSLALGLRSHKAGALFLSGPRARSRRMHLGDQGL